MVDKFIFVSELSIKLSSYIVDKFLISKKTIYVELCKKNITLKIVALFTEIYPSSLSVYLSVCLSVYFCTISIQFNFNLKMLFCGGCVFFFHSMPSSSLGCSPPPRLGYHGLWHPLLGILSVGLVARPVFVHPIYCLPQKMVKWIYLDSVFRLKSNF